MENPWKTIPLADYESHMAMPSIGQAEMLTAEFGSLLKMHQVGSAAIIGCAGGSGFEEAMEAKLTRLVGIDINENYLNEARQRFSHRVDGLELHCMDISKPGSLDGLGPVDLVFAALVFEYVDIGRSLRNIRRLCHPATTLATILQLPKADASAVSGSPYTSLEGLGAIMRLVPPRELHEAAEREGFELVSERTVTLASGKQFSLQNFARPLA